MGGDYYDRQMDQNTEENQEQNNEIRINNHIENMGNFPINQKFSGTGSVLGNTNTIDSYNSLKNKIGRQNGLHPSLDPKNYQNINMKANCKSPIVFALDVTGSMCEWPQIIYDKMPMFFGQIMMNKYLSDLKISFCAISDYSDEITLQVTQFSNAHEIDERISLLYLGGGMGPLIRHEAYESAGFFYSYMTELENCELPFFFLTCDEDYYLDVEKYRIKKKLGKDIDTEVLKGKKVFFDLMKKYNLFIIKKPYNDKIQEGELDQWTKTVGKNRIFIVDNPKACIDVILGAVALTNGRSLDDYKEDMKKRGQTNERIATIDNCLSGYYEEIKSGKAKIVRFESKIEIPEENLTKKDSVSLGKSREFEEFNSKFKGCDFSFDDELNGLFKEYLKVDKEFSGKIPEELICPLTNKLFLQPVKFEDGTIFEKQAIEKWMELFDANPINGNKLSNNYVPDYKISSEVNEYYESVKIFI
jgi:hypothetical protein